MTNKKTNPATGAPLRRRLQGGPWVAAPIHDQLITWQKRGCSIGLLIDRLTCFAVAAGYDPVTQTRSRKP